MARPPIKPVEGKLRVVLAVLRGEVSIKEAAGRERVSETSIVAWRGQFLDGGRTALAAGAHHGPSAREAELQAQVEELTSALGEAHVELPTEGEVLLLQGALGHSQLAARNLAAREAAQRYKSALLLNSS